MRLISSAFADGGVIPRRFTCDGEDVSPPLAWTDVPCAARSLVLLCDDPDAPAGTWHHWAIYDVPTDRTQLADRAAGNAAGFPPPRL
jgi:Raf kinase inhibitor-like YbhB/YbcL family protein